MGKDPFLQSDYRFDRGPGGPALASSTNPRKSSGMNDHQAIMLTESVEGLSPARPLVLDSPLPDSASPAPRTHPEDSRGWSDAGLGRAGLGWGGGCTSKTGTGFRTVEGPFGGWGSREAAAREPVFQEEWAPLAGLLRPSLSAPLRHPHSLTLLKGSWSPDPGD